MHKNDLTRWQVRWRRHKKTYSYRAKTGNVTYSNCPAEASIRLESDAALFAPEVDDPTWLLARVYY